MIKWPGSVHNVQIFAKSPLNKSLKEGIISSSTKVVIPGEPEVPFYILGDTAYPLLPFLIKQYANVNGGSTLE